MSRTFLVFDETLWLEVAQDAQVAPATGFKPVRVASDSAALFSTDHHFDPKEITTPV